MANQTAMDLIMHFEGFSPTAYQCPAGIWTIGWGNTTYEDGSPVKKGDKITEIRAKQLLEITVNKTEKQVRSVLTVPVSPTRLGSLISFAYNVGFGNFKKSTMLELINEGHFSEALDEFPKWKKAGGKVLNGLVVRRAVERDTFKE